jgi:hypothetical protein
MPDWQTTWQLRQCARPSIVTRHSKQIPMPHSGPRGSPLTDLRQWLTPAIATAADTMAPAGMVIETPLTESVTESVMRLQEG